MYSVSSKSNLGKQFYLSVITELLSQKLYFKALLLAVFIVLNCRADAKAVHLLTLGKIPLILSFLHFEYQMLGFICSSNANTNSFNVYTLQYILSAMLEETIITLVSFKICMSVWGPTPYLLAKCLTQHSRAHHQHVSQCE